ncbi:MAG: hypothetical protein JOZ07_03025 [Solirubrobacterales bacterium]|nr:hypothetical protein [Solirubrobacterales bacterium]
MLRRTLIRRWVTLVVIASVAAVWLAAAGSAAAGTVTMISCNVGLVFPQPPWQARNTAPGSFSPQSANCASGGRLQLAVQQRHGVPLHGDEQWSTVLPAAMSLTTFSFPAEAALVSTSLTNHPGGGDSGFSARFVSALGGVTFIDDGQPAGGGMDYARRGSFGAGGRYFILDVNCATSVAPYGGGCAQGPNESPDLLDIRDFSLVADDDQAPAITAPAIAPGGGDNLWSAGSWVRGDFNLSFGADDATGSGVCSAAAAIDGVALPAPPGASVNPNRTLWVQCPAAMDYQEAVDTAAYPNGAASVRLSAADAASPQNVAAPSKTIGIDNAPVSVALSGPSEVTATAANASATVTATASTGPSGADIVCSVDGGQTVEYSGASAQVPVSGLGSHQVSCYAQNHAVDASGDPARSGTQTYGVQIRQPTAEAVTFAHIADALRCHRLTVLVTVRGRTRVVRRHGRKILVRGRTRIVKRHVRRCHARTVRRVVQIVVRRHGKVVRRRRVIRVVVLPHPVYKTTRRIGHGKTTTVSGFLGLTDGTPLVDRPVQVLAAVDNGLGQFTLPVATTTTSQYGTWTVRVPAGPSRLIEAVYGGSATAAPAVSAPVTLTVPAKVKLLSATPDRVPWGGTVHLVGQLAGGYLPAGGALVRLRIGQGRAVTTYGVREHVGGDGRFTTTYRFGAGDPGVHETYWFEVASLPMGDYPWTPARSRRIDVTVGGPATVRHH